MSINKKIEQLGRIMMAIKYFHPSDAAAAADWNALMSAAFKELLQDQDLPGTYKKIVAPLVREHTSETNEPVYWQHIGVDTKHSFWEGLIPTYRSLRTIRDASTALSFNSLEQSQVRNFNGKTITLKWKADGAARPYILATNLQAKICLRHTPSEESISFEVREDTYELHYGFLLSQQSCAPRRLEVFVDGQNICHDSDFAQYFREQRSCVWTLKSTIHRKNSSNRSIEVIAPVIEGQIVPVQPASTEEMIFALGGEDSVNIPMVLTPEEALEPLTNQETRLNYEQLGRKAQAHLEAPVRLADVVLTWVTIAYFHPYVRIEKIPELKLEDLITDVLKDTSGDQQENILWRLLSHLNDGHCRLKSLHPGQYPPLNMLPVEEGYALAVAPEEFQSHLGDLITHIDGRSISELIAQNLKEVSASPGRKKELAGWRSLKGAQGSICQLRFTTGQRIEVKRENPFPTQIPVHHPPCFNPTEDTLYLDTSKLTQAEMLTALEQTKSTKVIFDVRGYPLGNHGILCHFIEKPINDPCFRYPFFVRPRDEELCEGYLESSWPMIPRRPYFQKKVAVLIHHRTQSYAEGWTALAKKIFPGSLIGVNTSGANGDIQLMMLPSGISLGWTQGHVIDHSGNVYFGAGLAPDHEVRPTAEDFKHRRDPLLTKALEILEGTQ